MGPSFLGGQLYFGFRVSLGLGLGLVLVLGVGLGLVFWGSFRVGVRAWLGSGTQLDMKKIMNTFLLINNTNNKVCQTFFSLHTLGNFISTNIN